MTPTNYMMVYIYYLLIKTFYLEKMTNDMCVKC